MRFKVLMNADDLSVLETRQSSRFVQKPLQAPLKVGGRLRRLGHDRQIAFAGRQIPRQILLDRHGNVQSQVPSQVGNAESSLTEDAVKLKAPYARPLGQRQAVFLTHYFSPAYCGDAPPLSSTTPALSFCGSSSSTLSTSPRMLSPAASS